ncbi:MAG: phage major capsid protein [Deinococcota bacterium]
MATTRSDLVIPEILMDAVQGAWPDQIALAGTGAAVESSTLPSNRGGDTVTVPYFGSLGEFEDVNEGDALTVATFAQSSEEATVQRTGKATELTTWAQMSALYADPYQEATRQMIAGAQRRFDSALITAATAAPLTSPADRPGDGAIRFEPTESSANVPIGYDVLVDALGQWGDEDQDVVAMVIHSKIRDDLRKLKDANDLPLFTDPVADGELPRILGKPVLVSDRIPRLSTPDRYMTLFIKRGALALWYNAVPTIETDRDILVDSDVMATNIYYVAHRYGRLPMSEKPGVVQLITT